jgi:hypothetical protein
VGKGKRVDDYLEVSKRRGHIFFGLQQVSVLRMLNISVDVYDLPINRLHHTF